VFARIEYKKYGPLVFISHLDLIRTWERIIRRARLPVVFTEGFHPKPKFSFAPPLPVGFEGERELLDIKIKEVPSDIKEMINQVVPYGILVDNIEVISNSNLGEIIIGGIYNFQWLGEIDKKELEEKLETMGLKEWEYSFKNLDTHKVEHSLSIHILFSSCYSTPKKIIELIEELGNVEWKKLSRISLLKK
jgi:radical SAM-linked protein